MDPTVQATVSPCPGCAGERTHVFVVDGLDCPTEVQLIESSLGALSGVCSVRASAVTGQATVVHNLEPEAIAEALAGVGLRARLTGGPSHGVSAWRSTAGALGLTLLGFLLGFSSEALAIGFYLPAILIGGFPIARTAAQRARQGGLDMNGLMTLAVLGAMAIGEWGEAATTVLLFSLAQLIEARSLERARKAIGDLMTLAPDEAIVRRDGRELKVAAERVGLGETLLVGPGDRIPLDGIVRSGISEVDQAPLTGEAQPVSREPGDGVLAGSINGSGSLVVEVTRLAGETTLARILRRIEEAQASRAPSQTLVDRFARIYTPAVVSLALLVGTLPSFLGLGSLTDWAYRALVLLVISCPCALVISTPVSIVSALTALSRRGVLVKGGAHLEALGALRAVAFDKTGTLTRGRPEVSDVVAVSGHDESVVLELAAAVECRSSHPLGRALRESTLRRGLRVGDADEVSVVPGRGIRGRVEGRRVLVGSHRYLESLGLCEGSFAGVLAGFEDAGRTALLVADEGPPPALLGAVAVADAPRVEAASAVARLTRDGLHVTLLSGDNTRTVEAVGEAVGIAHREAELLPEDKVERVRDLQERLGPTAMVGDGINDAPALATASVGIAMGEGASDVALETADVALLSEDLRLIPLSVRVARQTRRVVAQNVAIALGVKGLVLALALVGWGSLWAAVAADMGASLLVIGNGLRLLRSGAGAEVTSSGP